MRIVVFAMVLVGLAFLGFVGITGYFLAHAASGILTVGQLAATRDSSEVSTDPLVLGFRGNPMAALSLPFEAVQIDTDLGPAEAWLVPAAGIETGRAIYVHGIAGAREDGYRHLSTLHAAGFSVLLISYRNDPSAVPDPEGHYGFGLLEWPDLEAAVRYFAPDDSASLLVIADSMGGAITGQFLKQSPLANRVRAVALDSPALGFAAVIDHLSAQSDRPLPGVIAWVARKIVPLKTGLDLDQAEVLDTFAAFPGPLFLAHGASDKVVPIGPSKALAAARPDTTATLWTKADHLGSYAEDPAAYRKAFTDFLGQIGG